MASGERARLVTCRASQRVRAVRSGAGRASGVARAGRRQGRLARQAHNVFVRRELELHFLRPPKVEGANPTVQAARVNRHPIRRHARCSDRKVVCELMLAHAHARVPHARRFVVRGRGEYGGIARHTQRVHDSRVTFVLARARSRLCVPERCRLVGRAAECGCAVGGPLHLYHRHRVSLEVHHVGALPVHLPQQQHLVVRSGQHVLAVGTELAREHGTRMAGEQHDGRQKVARARWPSGDDCPALRARRHERPSRIRPLAALRGHQRGVARAFRHCVAAVRRARAEDSRGLRAARCQLSARLPEQALGRAACQERGRSQPLCLPLGGRLCLGEPPDKAHASDRHACALCVVRRCRGA